MEEPRIKVGICDGYPEIRGRLNGTYRSGGQSLSGAFTVRPVPGRCGALRRLRAGRSSGRPRSACIGEGTATFTLKDVTIGVRFHWERREEQTFAGDLTFLATGEGTLVAVNEIPVEEYLMSVVSSEMSGEAPLAFLKAHAIASRSWLVAMLQRGKREQGGERKAPPRQEGEIIRWYDREDHALFDVCADDHCQRYQGITGRATGRAAEAVRATRGVFLVQNGEICDARYHKACGGLTEDYATCWEERSVPYLSHAADSAQPLAPVRTEAEAERWILSRPDVYCRTQDGELLRQDPAGLRSGDSRFLPLAGDATAGRSWRRSCCPRRGSTSASWPPSCPSNGVPRGGSAGYGSKVRRPRWSWEKSWRSGAGCRRAICTAAPSSSARSAIRRERRPRFSFMAPAGGTASASARSGPPSWPPGDVRRRRSSGTTSAARRW